MGRKFNNTQPVYVNTVSRVCIIHIHVVMCLGLGLVVEICFACEVFYVCVFFPSPVGMYFCYAKLTDHNIFIILYGLTSVYFAVSHIIKYMYMG